MTDTTDEKMTRGRPMQSWKDTVKSDLQKCTLEPRLEESEDREKWWEIVEAAKAQKSYKS